MTNINWKVRIANKTFWLAIIPAILLVAQVVLDIFGVQVDFGAFGNQLLNLVNAIFAVLTILGVVVDPTTEGVGDSPQAMKYLTPKEF